MLDHQVPQELMERRAVWDPLGHLVQLVQLVHVDRKDKWAAKDSKELQGREVKQGNLEPKGSEDPQAQLDQLARLVNQEAEDLLEK